MKAPILKFYFLLLIGLFSLPDSYAQQDHADAYYKQLYYLCKAWGHAKYYHSEVAKGEVDWEEALLSLLSSMDEAFHPEEFNAQVLEMLQTAGPLGPRLSAKPSIPDSLNNNRDQTWIRDSIFSEDISKLLEDMYTNFGRQPSVYVSEAWPGGAPTFDSDNAYHQDQDFPNRSLRILALFRYWNIIHYFFPYKDLMDQPWDSTLVQFLPPIVGAQSASSYHLAFKRFTTYLNDSHAFFNSPTYWNWIGTNRPPFLTRFIEGKQVITQVLESENQVQVGDVILKINGKEIDQLRASQRRYAHGSNPTIVERTINDLVSWGPPGPFNLEVDGANGVRTVQVSRNSGNAAALRENSSPIWKQETRPNGKQVGIIDMGRLEVSQIPQMYQELGQSDALIFDIRSYPQGTLWTLVDYLFPGPIHIANFTTPDIRYPGRLTWQFERIGQGRPNPYDGEVLILFDERTQSQAEYTVMGLEQHPNALKLGSTTAAADGNVAQIFLPGKISTFATFLGTYYPDFSQTQRIGILPDIEVHPTLEGIRQGRDEVMEMAFAVLDGTLTSNSVAIGKPKLRMFPNPTSGLLVVELPAEFPQDLLHIQISNLLGNIVYTHSEPLTQQKLDLSHLPRGMYGIQVLAGSESFAGSFLKN